MNHLLIFQLISWISLPTVMFGGYSALTYLRPKLTPMQLTFFRAGHAHAGMLLVMSLAYYPTISQTSLSVTAQPIACAVLAAGIILQSGGFFWHAFLDNNGAKRTGIVITSIGALLLVVAISMLVVGLIAGLG